MDASQTATLPGSGNVLVQIVAGCTMHPRPCRCNVPAMPLAPDERTWTWDEYLAWETTQPIRHELIGGRVRAMGGGTDLHDAIANNLRTALHLGLRGHRCRAAGPDLKVKAGENGRYPDAMIDCGKLTGAMVSAEPIAVFEVLSKSTARRDLDEKLADYETVASIATYALISQTRVLVSVYTRDAAGGFGRFPSEQLTRAGDVLNIQDVGVAVSLAEIYLGTGLA